MLGTGKSKLWVLLARSGGFTLIELLVVLAIIALALSMTPHLAQNIFEAARVQAAAKTLAADLRLLRQQAIVSGQETQLLVDTEAQEYVRGIDHVLRKMPEGVRLTFIPMATAPDRSETVIRFFADGTSSGGRAILTHGNRNIEVTITWPFGRVRYQE